MSSNTGVFYGTIIVRDDNSINGSNGILFDSYSITLTFYEENTAPSFEGTIDSQELMVLETITVAFPGVSDGE